MFSKLKNLLTSRASGEAEPGKETPAARLDALLAQGQLNEAFELMKENGHSEVALLQLQWHTAQQQLEQKRLGTDAFNNTQSRLAHALRELVRAPGRNGGQAQPLPQEKRAQAPTPPSAHAASIDPLKRLAAIDLLAQSRFQEALKLLQHEGSDWESLLQRYDLLQRNERLGVIAAGDYKQALAELEQQVVQWVSGLEITLADQPAAIGFMRPTREEWERAAAEAEAGNWQEAVVIGQRWDASWLLLFSRLQRVIRDRQNGLATAADIVEALEGIKWSFEDLWAEEAKKWG